VENTADYLTIVLPAHFDLFTGDNDGFHLGDPSRDG
jgi:hypothetical protein